MDLNNFRTGYILLCFGIAVIGLCVMTLAIFIDREYISERLIKIGGVGIVIGVSAIGIGACVEAFRMLI